mgnify:CR=1 FL=1
MFLPRTNYERKLHLFGHIIADAISDDFLFEDGFESDEPYDLDGYLADLRPHIVEALEENWGDDLQILNDSMGGGC